MKLDIGTLAGIITRGDNLVDRLRGGNTQQTIAKLKRIVDNPEAAGRLLTDLDALEQHLRVLKLTNVETER